MQTAPAGVINIKRRGRNCRPATTGARVFIHGGICSQHVAHHCTANYHRRVSACGAFAVTHWRSSSLKTHLYILRYLRRFRTGVCLPCSDGLSLFMCVSCLDSNHEPSAAVTSARGRDGDVRCGKQTVALERREPAERPIKVSHSSLVLPLGSTTPLHNSVRCRASLVFSACVLGLFT